MKMKKFKQKLSLRASGREAITNEDCDLNASSTSARAFSYGASTYVGSTSTGEPAEDESAPWGLKQLCPGTDPVVE